MEKYRDFLILGLIIIGAYSLFRLHRSIRSDSREARDLCKKLNKDVSNPTLVVDNFVKDMDKICTRFAINIPVVVDGKKYTAHLSVFLGNKNYDYGKRRSKWVLIKY